MRALNRRFGRAGVEPVLEIKTLHVRAGVAAHGDLEDGGTEGIGKVDWKVGLFEGDVVVGGRRQTLPDRAERFALGHYALRPDGIDNGGVVECLEHLHGQETILDAFTRCFVERDLKNVGAGDNHVGDFNREVSPIMRMPANLQNLVVEHHVD